jgi:hypothetical protein
MHPLPVLTVSSESAKLTAEIFARLVELGGVRDQERGKPLSPACYLGGPLADYFPHNGPLRLRRY